MTKTTLLLLLFVWSFGVDTPILKLLNDTDKTNDATAITMLAKEATNDKESAFLLATLYKKGLIVPQNITTAIAWYNQAVKLGDVDAMIALSWLYYEDKHIPKDTEVALFYLQMAQKLGSKDAQELLEAMR